MVDPSVRPPYRPLYRPGYTLSGPHAEHVPVTAVEQVYWAGRGAQLAETMLRAGNVAEKRVTPPGGIAKGVTDRVTPPGGIVTDRERGRGPL